MRTLKEIEAALKNQDEVTVVELLDLSAEDIVDRFRDIIEKRLGYLRKELDASFDPFEDMVDDTWWNADEQY